MKNAQTTPKQVQPYAISVDWLQVYCFVDNPNIEEFTPLFSSQFEIVKLPHGTRQFKNVYEIYTVDREEDNPKNTVDNPIKHNRDYNNHATYKDPYRYRLVPRMHVSYQKSTGLYYHPSY